MNATPLLTRILRALHEHRLEAVLIGNAAAAMHGAPVTTLDFDFMFRDTPTNLRKLKAVAADLHAMILRPFYPVSRLYRVVDDDTGLQADFKPAKCSKCEFRRLARLTARLCERLSGDSHGGFGKPCRMVLKKLLKSCDAKALAALKAESERQLEDLIRRRLALPLEKRMNFLRRRLPGGGSAL